MDIVATETRWGKYKKKKTEDDKVNTSQRKIIYFRINISNKNSLNCVKIFASSLVYSSPLNRVFDVQ